MFPEKDPIRIWVDQAKDDQNPMIRWGAKSLEELYFEEGLVFVRTVGPDRRVPYTLLGVRVVALYDSKPAGLSIVSSNVSESPIYLANCLEDELDNIPFRRPADQETLEVAQEAVSRSGKQVLAALELGQTNEGDKVVNIIHPEAYVTIVRNLFSILGLNLGEMDIQAGALTIGFQFLQSTPFSQDKPIVLGKQREKFYPNEQNLGRNCNFWDLSGRYAGCNYPKVGLEGRTSCEGTIDDVCLFIKDGRKPPSLSEEQLRDIRFRPPRLGENPELPPGDIY